MTRLYRYFVNLLIALDQLLNAVFMGNPDETISSRAAKAWVRGDRWACVLCRVLDFFDRNHCLRVVERDEGRPFEEGRVPRLNKHFMDLSFEIQFLLLTIGYWLIIMLVFGAML